MSRNEREWVGVADTQCAFVQAIAKESYRRGGTDKDLRRVLHHDKRLAGQIANIVLFGDSVLSVVDHGQHVEILANSLGLWSYGLGRIHRGELSDYGNADTLGGTLASPKLLFDFPSLSMGVEGGMSGYDGIRSEAFYQGFLLPTLRHILLLAATYPFFTENRVVLVAMGSVKRVGEDDLDVPYLFKEQRGGFKIGSVVVGSQRWKTQWEKKPQGYPIVGVKFNQT